MRTIATFPTFLANQANLSVTWCLLLASRSTEDLPIHKEAQKYNKYSTAGNLATDRVGCRRFVCLLLVRELEF